MEEEERDEGLRWRRREAKRERREGEVGVGGRGELGGADVGVGRARVEEEEKALLLFSDVAAARGRGGLVVDEVKDGKKAGWKMRRVLRRREGRISVALSRAKKAGKGCVLGSCWSC